MAKEGEFKHFLSFALKIIIVHTVTYFIFGLIMSNLFDYRTLFAQEIVRDFMRPITSPYVLYGPFVQPIRGILYSIILWPLRNILFQRKSGWLILWGIFLVFGILAPPAAAPCSIEGVLYSKLPLSFHLKGFVEISLQTLAFSIMLTHWMKPQKQTSLQITPKKAIFLRIIFAVMIGCFAYIGYAIGGILSAKIAGRVINLSESAVSLKSQLMFVFAFGINVISILILTRKILLGRFSIWFLFIIFWMLDTVVPLIYQGLFLRMMPIYLALVLGFFPAMIIVISYKMNYKNFVQLNQNIVM